MERNGLWGNEVLAQNTSQIGVYWKKMGSLWPALIRCGFDFKAVLSQLILLLELCPK